MKKPLLLLLLIALPFVGSAQKIQFRIDSLRKALLKPQADTTRVWALMSLSDGYSSTQIDSSIAYANKSLSLAQSIQFRKGVLWGNISLAISLSERDIPKSMAMLYTAIQDNNSPDPAAQHRTGRCIQYIGLLYLYLRNQQQAMYQFKRCRELELKQLKRPIVIGACDREIGGAFLITNQLDSARYYLDRAGKEYPLNRQNPVYLFSYGSTEVDRNPTLALHYFQKSFLLAQQSEDLRILSFSARRLSEFHLNYTNQLDSAIYVAKIGVRAAQQSALYRGIYYNGLVLTEAYQRLGAIDSAFKYQTLMVVARDSAFSLNKLNQIQTTVITEQQRVQALEEEKSRFQLYSLLGLIVGLFGMAGILYRNNRSKQKANTLLKKLNAEVITQKEEIEAHRDNLEQTLETLQATQAQLIQKEKLASLGELTAGIAHEIQNPLNFVNNFSEVSTELVDELKEGPFQKLPDSEKEYTAEILGDLTQNLQKITHHGRRASSIVKGMLEHSRASTGERQPTDLNALADEYLRLAYHGVRAKNHDFNCELITDFDASLGRAEVVPQEIGRVLLNLFNNAFYAVGKQQESDQDTASYKPTVWISTRFHSPEGVPSIAQSNGLGNEIAPRSNGLIEIRIRDNGTGIPEAVKAKIFQPFFTTKPTGEGTGLGLSLSYDIVTKGHGGTLEVETKEGEGTTFLVKLPCA